VSRSFDYFFSGYLNTIQQEIAPDTSFIVYSGGDDLFNVASWEDAIELAKKIRSDFKHLPAIIRHFHSLVVLQSLLPSSLL
jgi:CRISPR-associated protein Csm1